MASGSEYSSDDNFYGVNTNDEDEDVDVEVDLTPCSNCGRKFNSKVLSRHFDICTKVKNRKAFDSKQQRMADLAKIPITTKPAAPSARSKPGKKKNWRWKHEQLITNIRSARVNGDSGTSNPSGNVNPDYVQCPHCKRRFNETAAERHIDFCKEKMSRIPKAQDPKYSDKKIKQDKRSSYKPPLVGAKKKMAFKEAVAKPRTNVNSAPTSQRVNPKASPSSSQFGYGERNSKSDTSMPGQRKKRSPEVEEEQHDSNFNNNNNNERYIKGKGRAGNEPKWFEELKRNDSGNQVRGRNNKDLDADPGTDDLNESNYSRGQIGNSNNNKNSPVGIVRPSSRPKENDFLGEQPSRTASSGRRKMASFCHDCGTKYPVPEAKFCCECGVKRMAFS